MVYELINDIKMWISAKENWQMIIIPILAPALIILGTYRLTIFKLQHDKRNKNLDFQEALKNEKEDIYDSIDLLTLLLNAHLESIRELRENISFNLLKNLTLSLFTNEPLVLLNQIPKNRLDLIFNRQKMIEKDQLLIYGSFLISRQSALQLYTTLNNWCDKYRRKSELLNMEFSDALLSFLNGVECEAENSNNDLDTRELMSGFIRIHIDYSSSKRYENESEVYFVDCQIDELVSVLKRNKFYFECKDFQLYHLKIKSVITKIATVSHNSRVFLQQTINGIDVQLQNIQRFKDYFNQY